MVKIAFFVSNLSYGGAQTMLVRLMKNLDRTKIRMKLFVRDSMLNTTLEDELREAGIECEFLNINDGEYHRNKVWHKIKSLRRLTKAINSYSPDIIHTHLELHYIFAYALFNNKKVMATIHSQPDRITSSLLKKMIKSLQKRNLLSLIGCADCVSKNAEKYWNVRSVRTIYNPIELSDYHTDGQKSDNEFKFIHIGRLHPIKNQKLLIRAFKSVVLENPNTRLVIVGEGNLRSELEKLCLDLNIDSKVDFLGIRSDVPELLAQSNAFVLSSDSECCPMTVLESIATGLPVVSTDVGGVGEIVKDAGILVEKGNEEELAQAMIKMCKDVNTYKIMSSNAQRESLNYDVKLIASEYEREYRYLINKGVAK